MCKIYLHFYDLFLATLSIPSSLLESNKFRECVLQPEADLGLLQRPRWSALR